MNPDIKQRWVEALRSGEYLQGTGTLHTRAVGTNFEEAHHFCCLGVLCDLAFKDGVIPAPELNVDDWTHTYGRDDDLDNNLLPKVVMRWAGLDLPGPHVHYVNDEGIEGEIELAVLNDGGVSFEEIARIIEEDEDL